ncbi:N-formylglutamate amidohydrolase [Meridianimarinicoccus sp. RP-17]|uniref:N-formylglutamate amidohydrolase n=1 Tax=Meridianimarinicoccus zhengii TaxID=2056810 RepID=UPI000DACBE00|nr:N-formylglutamate amidohydrolase [Phycocomes zhengii]
MHNDIPGTQDFGRPVETIDRGGAGGMVLVCEHASCTIPAALGDLGLTEAAARSHAAWDIGALALARGLSEAFAAPLVAARLSRLVLDCNRPPDAPDAIPAQSEVFEVPGNADLSAAGRATRVAQVYDPFHAAVAAACDRLAARTPAPVLVTVHSFTPVYRGTPRSVQLGLLHGQDDRLARAMLERASETGWQSALNQPYGPADGVLHTIDRHATARGWVNVMIELRNDLIDTPEGIAAALPRLTRVLRAGLVDLGIDAGGGS